ncbi:MAG: hypothetical protein ACF8R7_03595 [Phycisphaerales bacterium JB039]
MSSRLLPGVTAALVVAAGAPVSLADTHDFPSADSKVVASVGFIDAEQIGYFWSAARGDKVVETFADPMRSISRVLWEFDIPRNSLRESCNWIMSLNGTDVGKFSVSPGLLGPQSVEFNFPAVASVSGKFEVMIRVTNEVSPGAGSHTLRYALAGPHQITLGESGGPPCYADCDRSGVLDFFDFLCFQNAFATGDKYADCDGTGVLDFFDFLCFQNEFAAGCPTGPVIEAYGDGPPPREVCGCPTTDFPRDPRATMIDVTDVPSPLCGAIGFSIPLNHRAIGAGWATWSHGYTGDVYYTNGASSVDVTMPAHTTQFRAYAEPNPFSDIEFEVTAMGVGGTTSLTETISGSSGAKGYGFCDDSGLNKIRVRTTDMVTDFAIGEFAICTECPGGEIVPLGDGPPPAELCGTRMTPFPRDSRPTLVDVTNVPSPLGGSVNFSIPCSHRVIGGGWATWSHGYTGDVYYTNGSPTLEMTLPADTSRFQTYVEPNPFSLIEFEIILNGGADSLIESISGSSGARGYGFCGDVNRVRVRTTDGVTDFAVGEFAIAKPF